MDYDYGELIYDYCSSKALSLESIWGGLVCILQLTDPGILSTLANETVKLMLKDYVYSGKAVVPDGRYNVIIYDITVSRTPFINYGSGQKGIVESHIEYTIYYQLDKKNNITNTYLNLSPYSIEYYQ